MLNQGYGEIINIATLASLIGEWWTFRVWLRNPCLNYHPPACSDEGGALAHLLQIQSVGPKFSWVVHKTIIRLRDFKARKKEKCFVFCFFQKKKCEKSEAIPMCASFRSIHSTARVLPGGRCPLWDIWYRLETFLVVTSGGGCYLHLVGRSQGSC